MRSQAGRDLVKDRQGVRIVAESDGVCLVVAVWIVVYVGRFVFFSSYTREAHGWWCAAPPRST